jgi:two-component system, chemotaxis family, sensor kinase CheA
VSVTASLRADGLTVTVTDDGAGLDLAAIRARLVAGGLPVPGDDRELARTLFESGMSTRAETTAISGRGVGLDVVRAAMKRIRGSVDLTWVERRGTTFTLECPPTLATIRAVLASVGPQLVAMPTACVERLLRVRRDDVKQAEGRDMVISPSGPIPLASLARLLPPLVERPATGARPVIVLRVAERRLAVAVDDLVVEQELVVRPVLRDQELAPHVSGAAIVGSGQVVLVLNPATIIGEGLGLDGGARVAFAPEAEADRGPRRILVVDDSITTRTLEQSILEAAGYVVMTAADGADGWRLVQERGCDLVVADVEMPRMDGFALCEAIRGSKRHTKLPVVLVTALETPEHRMRGLEAGADAYLGKSSFDQQALLDTIGQLVG